MLQRVKQDALKIFKNSVCLLIIIFVEAGFPLSIEFRTPWNTDAIMETENLKDVPFQSYP